MKSQRMQPGQRLRDLALILPLGAAMLLTPPLIRILDLGTTVAGVPLLHVHLFAVWLAAIVLTGVVARRIARAAGEEADRAAADEDGGEPPRS